MKLILSLSTLLLLISLASTTDRSDLENDLNKYCMEEPSCITEGALDMYYFVAGEGFGEDMVADSGAVVLDAVVELVELVCGDDERCVKQLYQDLHERIHEDEMK